MGARTFDRAQTVGIWPTGRRGLLVGGGALVMLALLAGFSVGGTPAAAALPGLNGRIACDGERGSAPGPAASGFPGFVTPRNEVYTMNPDGSDFKLLTDNKVADIDPSFSPDGAKLAFSSARSSSFVAVFTMNADGADPKRLVFVQGPSFGTSWSPDGANIAFQDGSSSSFEVSRVGSDGTGLRRLTGGSSVDGGPTWSPDGSAIAFTSNRDGTFVNFQIFTMSAEEGETRNLRQLTRTGPLNAFSFGANWSPDGARLAFLSGRDGNAEIYSMKADGSDVRRLTNSAIDNPATTSINESEDTSPAYSPDGTKIVFESARSGDYEVYTMNAADGSGLTRLTNSPGFDGRCDWQPVRAAVLPQSPGAGVGPAPGPGGAGTPDVGAEQSRRARALRSCLASAARHARRERRLTRRGSARRRAGARRHLRRHRRQLRRRCLRRHGRTPGRITGLRARAASRTKVELSFRAPGTHRARGPAAHSYVVKQSRGPIRGGRGFRRAQTLCGGSCRFNVTRVGARLRLRITDLRPGTTYYYAVAARDNVSRRLGPRARSVRVRTR